MTAPKHIADLIVDDANWSRLSKTSLVYFRRIKFRVHPLSESEHAEVIQWLREDACPGTTVVGVEDFSMSGAWTFFTLTDSSLAGRPL